MKPDPLGFYSGKRVLITGDTGFKGSWLAIWLLKLGARVTGMGLPPKSREDNFSVAGLARKIDHIDADVRDFTTVADTIRNSKPDIVFHLAAQALVLDSYKDPLTTFTTNFVGTLNVLESIRRNPGVSAAVMVTSDKCYENHEWVHGYRESDPLGGKDPYSASKGAAEILISSYERSFFHDGHMTAVASVRAGNVIGGGDWSENRIVPDCIRSLRANHPLEIRNPCSIRPWQHVLEPLFGYLLLGAALSGSEGRSFSGPWNFGPYPGSIVPVEELAKEIIRHWGAGSYFVPEQREEGRESGILILDIHKAVHRLNWRPALSLRKAIEFAIHEYRIEGLSESAVFNQRSADIDEYTRLQSRGRA